MKSKPAGRAERKEVPSLTLACLASDQVSLDTDADPDPDGESRVSLLKHAGAIPDMRSSPELLPFYQPATSA
jgi:hypothetical protein